MSSSPLPAVSSAWRFALVGALASLPVTVVLNRLPASEADVAGGVMIVGAFVAGALAARRSTDPTAAGLRTGLLAGGIALLTPTVGTADSALGAGAIVWPSPSRLGVFVLWSPIVLGLSAVFGWAFGRLGGWVVTVVTARRTATHS